MKISVKYMQIKGLGISDGQVYENVFEVERPSRVKFPEAFAAKKCAEKNMLFGEIIGETEKHYDIPDEALKEFETGEVPGGGLQPAHFNR